jgi:hypothetical protein
MSPFVEISLRKFHIVDRSWFHTSFVAARVCRYASAETAAYFAPAAAVRLPRRAESCVLDRSTMSAYSSFAAAIASVMLWYVCVQKPLYRDPKK